MDIKPPKMWDGKMVENEEHDFPLQMPIIPEPLNIARIKSYLIYGDDKHIEKSTVEKNRKDLQNRVNDF